jgi:hypothetical protein
LLSEQRREVAVEAARIMAEEGVRNHLEAKTRAAERLGLYSDALLPKNTEVERAFREHLSLFKADTQPQLLRDKRKTALEAMAFFQHYRPRLVGAVLDGSADEHSAVCLHLFADTEEEVAFFLDEHGIPYDISTRSLRMSPTDDREVSVYEFVADEQPIDLTVLPHDAIRQAPLSRIDARPIKRASLNQLRDNQAWLDGEDSAALQGGGVG